MNSEFERAGFENAYRAEVVRRGHVFDSAVFARNGDEYVIGHVQAAWWAWGVRAAQDPELPAEPPRALLISMALRLDHGLGVPGYYDDPIFARALGGGVTHARRLECAIDDMRKVYEEVSGRGYYCPEREAFYLGLEQPATNEGSSNG